MEIADSARKHGISDEDIRHATAHPISEFPQELADRVGLIGPARDGRFLEVVVLDPDSEEDEPTAIHADDLAPKRYRYLP